MSSTNPKFPFSRTFPVYSFRHLKMPVENAEEESSSTPQCYVAAR